MKYKIFYRKEWEDNSEVKLLAIKEVQELFITLTENRYKYILVQGE